MGLEERVDKGPALGKDGRSIGDPTGKVGHGINRKVKIGSMRKTTLLAIGITALAVWLGAPLFSIWPETPDFGSGARR